MYGDYNKDKRANVDKIRQLVQEGYTDLGWANGGKDFTVPNNRKESIDCSTYANRGTDVVYIDRVNKEILHVDMSD